MKKITSLKLKYFLPSGGVPISGGIEAVVGQEVIVELPEDVERDPAVRRQHVVVRFPEHVVVVV
jgi:hypothetical protein